MFFWFMSILILLMFCVLVVVCTAKNVRISRHYLILIVVVALAAAYWGYALQPGTDLDLYRIQLYAKGMDISGKSIWKLLVNADGKFPGFLTFNLMCVVINIIGDYSLISATSVFIVEFITLYIIFDFHSRSKMSSKYIIWEILLANTGMPITAILSGVRNSIAVAFVALAVYMYLYRGKTLKSIMPLLLLSATMHPAALFAVPAIILARFKGQRVLRIAALFFLPIVFAFGQLLSNLPWTYTSFLSQRLEYYSTFSYGYGFIEMITNMALFVLVYLLDSITVENHNGESNVWKLYVNAYCILGFALLGCVVQRDFATRFCYLLGAWSAPVVINAMRKMKNQKNTTSNALSGMCLLGISLCIFVAVYRTIVGVTSWTFI